MGDALYEQAPLNRDSPDGLGPTTAADLSDDRITVLEIGKPFADAAEGVSGRCRVMM